ncbi:MAG: hypothetical protein PHG60_02070 [Candidatus Dojkabacteria bacterium]|jgi:hypothetical protein|nr:hypothetical protein [Candidatus Dojkabacteria bacterium]MDD2270345.1 hypothetical protein [Candidatus Dojkabacteria bacterium]
MPFTALQFVQNSKNSNSFIGVFRYLKTSGVKSSKEGELYGFVTISSEGNLPAERVAHIAWDGVVEGYMYSQSKSISESLKSGIQEFTRRLKDLMRNSKELEESGIDASLVIISATKEGVYVANLGENEIYAYRGEKVVDIIEILEKNNAQTAGFIISDSDLLVISTASLISENMHTLVGKNSREDVLKALNLLGKTLLPNQAVFSIYSEKEGKAEPLNTELIEEKIELRSRPLEPKKIRKEGKKIDLKRILDRTKEFFSTIFTFLKKISIPVILFFKKTFAKVWVFINKKLGNQRWFKKYAAKASEMRLKKRAPGIRIDGYKVKDLRTQRFKVAILGTIAVIVAVAGYQYARKQKVLRELHAQADQVFEEVNKKLDSAKGNLATNTSEAEKEVFSASNLLNDVPEGIDEEHIKKMNELEQKVLGVEDSLYKRVVASPESFVGFFENGTELTDMKYILDDSGNEMLLITDKGTGSVWRVSIYDRSKSRMADNEGLIKSPKYVDVGNEGDIFVYDQEVGVLKATVSGSDWSPFKKLTGVGLSNIGIKDVVEFAVLTATDNLYYLDRDNARIVKSVNYGTGYSSTVTTVINDENFSKANDFFADFSIYILTSGNEGVLRYSAGSYVPITVVGVNGEMGELTCGNTSGNMDFAFYMFDQGNKRVLKLEKPKDSYNDKLHPNELVLLNQYVYRGDNNSMWDNVKEIAVDRAEKYMYVLDGNNVWRISL